MVASVKSLMVTGWVQNSLTLIAAVTWVPFSDDDLVLEFGNKVLLFVVSLELSKVCSASVAVCCLHCFHCRFALALDTVGWTCLVVRESHAVSLAQCELCMLHVPHLCAFPCLQNQVYFPSMIVLVSCLRRVKTCTLPIGWRGYCRQCHW